MGAYILDTEQTGLPETDPEIIEIAWIRLRAEQDLAGGSDRINTEEAEYFEQRYQPSKPSTFGAMAVHHILPEELAGRPPSYTFCMPDECTYLIGHSIDYDWKALCSPDVKRICTRAMAEHVWPEADSYSQSALLYMLLGPTPETRDLLRNAHSAMTDCENCLTVLRHILRAKPDITTWSALWEFSEECRIPLVMPITKARGTPLTEIDDGLLDWCLDQYWLPAEHPYLHAGLVREYKRRQQMFDTDPAGADDDDDFEIPF